MKKRFLLDDMTDAFCGENRITSFGREIYIRLNGETVYLKPKTVRKMAAAMIDLADAAEREAKE